MATKDEIEPTRVPELVSGVDMSKAQLLPQEGFVLSQIDGKLTVEDLKFVTGLHDEEIRRVLQKLMDLGIARLRKGSATPLSTPRRSEAAQSGPDKDSRSFEDKVRDLYINIDDLNYYRVLGVDRKAESKEIRAAYYKLTKEYHPDRLFRRGSDEIRERLQHVFARINEAYRSLSDDKERWEYDKELKKYEKSHGIKPEVVKRAERVKQEDSATVKPAGPPQKPVKPVKPTPAPAGNPFSETVAKAKRFYEGALMEIRKKNYSAARQNLRLAISLDPFNKIYPETLQKVEGMESKDQALKLFQDGVQKEGENQLDEALRLYREATLLDGENARYYTKWARVLIEHKNNPSQAKTVIQKAFNLGTNEPEAYLVMGLVLKGIGQRPQAIAQFEAGLKIDPGNKELKRELKHIKKGK